MPIGSQSGLDFFVAQTFFDDQWVLTHANQQGGVGMPQGMDFNAVDTSEFCQLFEGSWQSMLAGGNSTIA